MGCFNIFAAASQSRDEQLKRMTEAPIGPLIISLAIPTILSMLTTALYNTADTYFVSQLGTSASGAVGVVFCLMAIFQATGFTLGICRDCPESLRSFSNGGLQLSVFRSRH